MRGIVSFIALVLQLALFVAPGLALDRVPSPGSVPVVVSVADRDSPALMQRNYHSDGYWRYRAAYTRWMHNEYQRAGYPVRHRHFRTYRRTYVCCHHYRRW